MSSWLICSNIFYFRFRWLIILLLKMFNMNSLQKFKKSIYWISYARFEIFIFVCLKNPWNKSMKLGKKLHILNFETYPIIKFEPVQNHLSIFLYPFREFMLTKNEFINYRLWHSVAYYIFMKKWLIFYNLLDSQSLKSYILSLMHLIAPFTTK